MSGGGVVALGALLTAAFLGIVGVLVWQEGRRRPSHLEPTYVVEEAVGFIWGRLAPELRRRLGKADVRRIIEWEVFYLQGLAQKARRTPVETVAGGIDASIDYIAERIDHVHGITYDRADIAEVLRLEADYLASIGAVGEAVDGEDEQVERDEA